jgi:uncharacterized coiled-coil DUF342 family protein
VQSQPFFTNDPTGLVKLILSLGTFAAIIIGGFWKIMSSKLTRDNEDLGNEVDGVGKRVDTVKESDTRAHTRIDELVRRVDAKDIEIREVTGDIGRLEAKVDQMLSQSTENKIEIIDEFQKTANEMRNGLHGLELKMERVQATMDERERVRQT